MPFIYRWPGNKMYAGWFLKLPEGPCTPVISVSCLLGGYRLGAGSQNNDDDQEDGKIFHRK